MATSEQIAALLTVPCPHCRAGRGEPCGVSAGPQPRDSEGGVRRRDRRPITTLDGGAHDARWRAALGTEAAVVVDALSERQKRPVGEPEIVPGREPVLAGAALPDRPW